ncbi:MAG TPA: T9SS type A sorting domain-containing protein [Candidatus Eisenbacteria bacterium]|uniref:T9SS type A sorting domain-containing protein n=1 Tax=Eiseniibacteriota bacterium TaxID=2212470 RepID=A0A7V2F2K2_UNCEI|nr:T9SS type A sorting domain-containing protein [Candidatus Eisenbacteria bacterium]
MRRLATCTAVFVCVLMLTPDLVSSRGFGLGRLRQDQLEIGRSMLEVQNVDWTTLLCYYADDIEYHCPIVDVYGIEMVTEFLGRLYGSSPDLVTTIEDETLVDGVYSATWTMVGSFIGVPYEAKGISIIKFRPRSREVYYWRDYYTEGDIMTNIPGFDEVVLGFRTYYRCAVDPTFDCPLELATADALPAIEPMLGSPAADNRGGGVVRLRQERLEIGRALVEINPSNWQSLLQYYTDDYEYHDPIVDIYGFDTLVPFFARLFASSPDLVTTVEDEMLIGGVYTATWTMVGQFNGVPYSAKGMSILKFRDWSTQTYYSRDYYSESDIMATIPGLDQAVEAFRISYKCVVDPAFDCPLPPPATLEADGAEVAKGDALQPSPAFSLQQNVPNPFNPTTTISFVVPDGGANVSLKIYDSAGRLVRTLVNGYETSGTREVTWYGENDQGQPVSSGVYFYQLTAPSFSNTKKMVLLR